RRRLSGGASGWLGVEVVGVGRALAGFVVAVGRVPVLLAGAADDDLVLLDRDGHGAVARPVLGIHRIVLHGRVEPQAVALVAVVEGPLERLALAPPAAAAPAAAPAAALR